MSFLDIGMCPNCHKALRDENIKLKGLQQRPNNKNSFFYVLVCSKCKHIIGTGSRKV